AYGCIQCTVALDEARATIAGMNYVGSTWGTHFLLCSLMRQAGKKFPDAENELLRACTEDLAALSRDGIANSTGFLRNFAKAPKQSSSRKPCEGLQAEGAMENNMEPTFFETDFWHNWHNGLAKLFIASVVVLYMTDGILPGTTIPERFRWLSEDYRAFCKSAGFTPFLLELTKDTFGYESYKKAPLGSWNKAVVSTHLMLYLDNLSARRVLGKTEDQLLLNDIVHAALQATEKCIKQFGPRVAAALPCFGSEVPGERAPSPMELVALIEDKLATLPKGSYAEELAAALTKPWQPRVAALRRLLDTVDGAVEERLLSTLKRRNV
ncbi:unnamed protein product, partial [Symbiodinium sp. KB8]